MTVRAPTYVREVVSGTPRHRSRTTARSVGIMAASDGQTQALAEALRQGERILDHQVGMAAAARADAESVVRLSVATLGGLIAVGAAMRAATATHEVVSLVGFGLATGTVFAAVLLAAFAGGRLGSGLGLTVGPDMGKLRAACSQADVHEERIRTSVLESVATWVKDNSASIRLVEDQRLRALVLLAVSASEGLVTLGLILGGAILG